MIQISAMKITYLFLLLKTSSYLMASSYNSSPYNYKNSPYNYDNSQYNYKNNPYNYDNSPYNPSNDRIIRNERGQEMGYMVPKDDGGANIFDFNGNRLGYLSSD